MIKSDGNYTTPQMHGPPRWVAPFASNEYCMFEQDYMQLRDNWAPGALGTAFAASGPLSGFVLVKESDHNPDGPLVRWTRSYAKVPASWDEWANLSYNFIGFLGAWGINAVTVTGRPRVTRIVPCRIAHDYFLLGSAGCETVDKVPLLQAQTYSMEGNPLLYTDYLSSNPPFTANTVPSRNTYNTWVANAQAHAWACDPVTKDSAVNPAQIVAETSEPRRWLGPMFERVTKFILPE